MEPGLGVLAHITSLPASSASKRLGSIGPEAYKFVDWLANAGVRYWLILPVNPNDDHGSPYAGISAFAGNGRLLEEYPELDACDIDADEFAALDSMDCSTPGFPVLHCLPECVQTHVH